MINQIIEDNNQVQENLCLIGAIPAILAFAEDVYSSDIRLEVAKFVKQVCSGSRLTHQMFIACGGLPHLVNFLKTDSYAEDRDLIFMAVDGIQSVFELHVRDLSLPFDHLPLLVTHAPDCRALHLRMISVDCW